MPERLNGSHYSIDMYLFEDGCLPQPTSERQIGYDVFARAIISPTDKDPDNPASCKTIFDFNHIPGDASSQSHIEYIDHGLGMELAWRIDRWDRALVGIGFAISSPNNNRQFKDAFYLISPRRGLASMYGITIANDPGTADIDSSAEAGVLLINNGVDPFYVTKHARIAQLIFGNALKPEFNIVTELQDLGNNQQPGGFGNHRSDDSYE